MRNRLGERGWILGMVVVLIVVVGTSCGGDRGSGDPHAGRVGLRGASKEASPTRSLETQWAESSGPGPLIDGEGPGVLHENGEVWTSSGEWVEGAQFGYSVASSGDVDDDGYEDVVIGADNYHTPEGWHVGKAYLYHGGPGWLSLAPGWSSSGDEEQGSWFGSVVSSAGDVNDDGYADVLISAESSVEASHGGKVFLFLGGPAGLDTSPAWTRTGDSMSPDFLGLALAAAGDVDGDGFDDVLIGAPGYDSAQAASAGEAYLFRGSWDGLSDTPAWSSVGDDWPLADFGGSLDGAGDINGDGFADIIIGAPGQAGTLGKVFVFHGGPSGPSDTPDWTEEGKDPDLTYLGSSVASAGDVNGDGFSDVVIGAQASYSGGDGFLAGAAVVHLGSLSGLSGSPDWMSNGDAEMGVRFGARVASAGDMDGDGFFDVLVTARATPLGLADNVGEVFLFLGGPNGLTEGPRWSCQGDGVHYGFYGWSIASAGDVNGDGRASFLVGSPGYDSASRMMGKVYLYDPMFATP